MDIPQVDAAHPCKPAAAGRRRKPGWSENMNVGCPSDSERENTGWLTTSASRIFRDLAARIVQALRPGRFRRLIELGKEISGLEVHASKATQTF
jgi:hypothetical protein